MCELGFLDEPMWSETRWYGWRSGAGQLTQIAAIFQGGGLPGLMLHGENAGAGAQGFIESLTALLPKRFYGEFSLGMLPLAAQLMHTEQTIRALKMHLTRPAAL